MKKMHKSNCENHEIFVQNLPAAITLLSNKRFELSKLIDFGGCYIYRDSHENNEYNRICSEQMDKTMRSFIIKMANIFLSFSLAIVGPTYGYFYLGIRSTTVEVRIPFTKENSDAEFVGRFILQSIIAFHGILMYTGVEVFIALLSNVIIISPLLIKFELKQLCDGYKTKSIIDAELRYRFKNIVKQSRDIDK